MKIKILLGVFFSSLSASASFDYVAAIASDFDILLSDTVNEGDRTANVAYDGNEAPAAECETVPKKSQPGTSIAKCRINIKVKIDGCGKKSTFTDCFVIYEFQSHGAASVVRGPDSLLDACIEKLSSLECGD